MRSTLEERQNNVSIVSYVDKAKRKKEKGKRVKGRNDPGASVIPGKKNPRHESKFVQENGTRGTEVENQSVARR